MGLFDVQHFVDDLFGRVEHYQAVWALGGEAEDVRLFGLGVALLHAWNLFIDEYYNIISVLSFVIQALVS